MPKKSTSSRSAGRKTLKATKSSSRKSSSRKSKKSSSGCLGWGSLLIILSLIVAGVYLAHKYKDDNGTYGRTSANAISTGGTYKVRGIDISHHNGNINWKKVKKDNIRFVYIKSTQGRSHLNRGFRRNYGKAKDLGVTAGFYHFFMFESDGEKQAHFFLRNSPFEGHDLPPAVDVEYSPPDTRRRTDKISVQKRIHEIHRFDSTVYAETGIHPVIYTNKECYRDLIKGNFPDNELWIADINSENQPDINEKWIFWQYSHHGKVKGINIDVDMNVFNGNSNDFSAWLAKYE